MSIAEALDDILKHPQSNIIERFRENGCSTAYDLKYFDWCALKELKCLSEMDIKKIMRFIKERNVAINYNIILLCLKQLENASSEICKSKGCY